MEIVEFLNEDNIRNTITNPINKEILYVIDCGATWCGPCKIFAKFYSSFVESYPITDPVVFCKLDIDIVPDFCEVNSITNVPTILFIRDSEVIEKVIGADTNKFKNTLSKCLQQKSNQTIQNSK